MNAMTSRERLLAAIRRLPVDHVPCSSRFNPLTPVQRHGWTWNFPWAEDAGWAEQIRHQVEVLGLDQVVDVWVETTQPTAGITERVWWEKEVLHKAYTTPAGELHAAIRHNDLWPHGQDIPFHSDFNIGHFVKPWIQNRADLECFQQLFSLRDPGEVIAGARVALKPQFDLARQYNLATMACVGLGLTGAMPLFGVNELCLITIEEPALVDAYLEFEHTLNLQAIAVLGELGVDILRRNGFYETGDFYGPDVLARLLTRRLNAEAEAARRGGMVTSYTVNTGLMPILDHLAALKLDSLFGLDIAFKGVDLHALRDKLAPTKALWIGPSSAYHIWKSPEATRQAVRDVLECFGKVGLILTQCVSSHSIMPWANTLAMIEEWKKLR